MRKEYTTPEMMIAVISRSEVIMASGIDTLGIQESIDESINVDLD